MEKTGNIYLIGFMGVGKSTVSMQLRELLGWEEIDTDQALALKMGMGIPNIFEKYGENHFRDLETGLLQELAGQEGRVVSCGGGMILREENRSLMKQSGTVVLLRARPDTIYEHVKYGKDRPLLNGNMNVEYIRKLLQEREPYYALAKDVEVTVDGLTPRQVARQIMEAWKQG